MARMVRYRFLGGVYHLDLRHTAGQQVVTLPGKSPASAQTRGRTRAVAYEKRAFEWRAADGRHVRGVLYIDRSKTADKQQALLDDYREQMGG